MVLENEHVRVTFSGDTGLMTGAPPARMEDTAIRYSLITRRSNIASSNIAS